MAEVLGTNLGVWAFDRLVLNAQFARVSADTIYRNALGGWQWDYDDFQTNQALHPYHGSVYFNIGRSTGFGFWSSAAFAVGGSLAWKIVGESERPSVNDQITTPIAGTILGEPLFRLSRLVLARGHHPGPIRWVAATLISPAATFNAAVLDGAFGSDPPVPPWEGRLTLGAAAGAANTTAGTVSLPVQPRIALDITYGLPELVTLERPFDHFELSLDLRTATAAPWARLNDVRGPAWLFSIRGLVAGGAARTGARSRVLYGLFGTFDYGGPLLFRVGTSGVGPGAVVTLRPAPTVALEATGLAAATFGSAGGHAPEAQARDYRFSFGGLLLGDLRVAVGTRFELRARTRIFLVPSAIGGGTESLLLSSASAFFNLAGPHAVSVDVLLTRRTVDVPGSRLLETSRSASLSYVYRFGGGGD